MIYSAAADTRRNRVALRWRPFHHHRKTTAEPTLNHKISNRNSFERRVHAKRTLASLNRCH